MNRLSRYIESEFTRNSWFFAEAESGMMAALEFIDYVLKDKNLIQLTDTETKYINKVSECYSEMMYLNQKMKETIEKYKQAYYDALAECEN